jgi:hypothetical protein
MKMTMAGKIALFMNLALSVIFAFWGFGIYSQRINWTDKKIGEREGEYAKRAAEIKQLQEVRTRVDGRWAVALGSANPPRGVLGLEALEPVKQAWYKQQLDILKTGDAKQKILAIDFEQGRIKVDPRTGFPVMSTIIDQNTKQPIPGLASLRILDDAYAKIHADILAVTAEIEELVNQEKALTEQLGDGKVRGLRFDLAQQQLAEKKSLDEQEYLQPLLYNSMVEQQSLEDRQKAFEAAVKRLQTSSVAKQP